VYRVDEVEDQVTLKSELTSACGQVVVCCLVVDPLRVMTSIYSCSVQRKISYVTLGDSFCVIPGEGGGRSCGRMGKWNKLDMGHGEGTDRVWARLGKGRLIEKVRGGVRR